MKPATVLVPENNIRLLKIAAEMDGHGKVSIYLRTLVNKDLREKGLLPPQEDIVLYEVVWNEDGSVQRRGEGIVS